MVLWFGLKERVKDLEENMKELIEANESMLKQLKSIDDKLSSLTRQDVANEYTTPAKKLSEADKYLARLEKMKYLTIRRKIESLEKLLGAVPEEAVESAAGEGISKDLITQVLDFVKQNPDVVAKVQELLKQWKAAPTPQQKEEVKESIYDILKPIPLRVQTQTQQQSSQQQ
ncbi:MAG: hypothetical protein QW575_06310 [Thermoproteota archaeon]